MTLLNDETEFYNNSHSTLPGTKDMKFVCLTAIEFSDDDPFMDLKEEPHLKLHAGFGSGHFNNLQGIKRTNQGRKESS